MLSTTRKQATHSERIDSINEKLDDLTIKVITVVHKLNKMSTSFRLEESSMVSSGISELLGIMDLHEGVVPRCPFCPANSVEGVLLLISSKWICYSCKKVFVKDPIINVTLEIVESKNLVES